MPRSPTRSRRPAGARTLCVDVGGTSIKAAVLDESARLVGRRLKVATPDELDRPSLLGAIAEAAAELGAFDRVSLGIPGIVHRGVVYAIPISENPELCGFDVAGALRARLGAPVRVLNDAEMHGLGAITGKGVEMIITLGTGLGTALFVHGELGPRWHIAEKPGRDALPGGPYGKLARKEVGDRKWMRRVALLVDHLRQLTNFDHLYIGGGESKRLDIELPDDVTRVDNHAALVGGARLWDWELGPYAPLRARPRQSRPSARG
jgi:polyphosphate glucokinase